MGSPGTMQGCNSGSVLNLENILKCEEGLVWSSETKCWNIWNAFDITFKSYFWNGFNTNRCAVEILQKRLHPKVVIASFFPEATRFPLPTNWGQEPESTFFLNGRQAAISKKNYSAQEVRFDQHFHGNTFNDGNLSLNCTHSPSIFCHLDMARTSHHLSKIR